MNTLTSAIAVAVACAGVAACATAAPYSAAGGPDHPGTARLHEVSSICRNVLGLTPSERLSAGTWPGDVDLPPVTSHYRGCITSLSDSLQQASSAASARRADAGCRAQGLAPGSPALALCVLQAGQEPAAAHSAPLASAPAASAPIASAPRSAHAGRQSSQAAPVAVGSLFYASGRETVRREQLACASLGFEPPDGQFASCVHNLQATFFAIDNPIE